MSLEYLKKLLSSNRCRNFNQCIQISDLKIFKDELQLQFTAWSWVWMYSNSSSLPTLYIVLLLLKTRSHENILLEKLLEMTWSNHFILSTRKLRNSSCAHDHGGPLLPKPGCLIPGVRHSPCLRRKQEHCS